jgi:NADPH:quinone reductase-like Zn-dependent oxidoreductase
MVFGLNKLRPKVGAFAQYVRASANLLLKIPDHMSFEEAATLGMGVSTTTLALFVELQVPATLEPLSAAKGDAKASTGSFVLVAGGSTTTGTRAVRLLKL